MILRCPTKYAVLLLAVRGTDGVFRFPSNETTLKVPETSAYTPGLVIEAKALMGVFEQLTSQVIETLGLPNSLGLDIRSDFAEPLPRTRDAEGTLFVGNWNGDFATLLNPPTMTPLPHLIRAMGKRKERVAYLKAWQVLSGAASERTAVLETDDLARYLTPPVGVDDSTNN